MLSSSSGDDEGIGVMAANTTKRAPAKRTPAKKTAAKTTTARKATAATPPAPTSDLPPNQTYIEFRGRQILVKMPSLEQLDVWNRTAKRLANTDTTKLSGQEAFKLLERATKLIHSVMVKDEDKDWLDDQLLDGDLTLYDAATGIVTQTVDAFHLRTKAQAPTTGPAPRARRRR